MVQSYLSDKIEQRTSKITGMGIFAKETIHKGEVICVKGGHILKRNEMFSSAVINSYHPISDDLYIAAKTLEEEENIKIYINHSCNPNCGLRGEITFVAMREIQKDEEVTFDYAFLDNESYKFECHCGALKCRHVITGYDWKIKRLQEEYYPYFAAYLREKIDLERKKDGYNE